MLHTLGLYIRFITVSFTVQLISSSDLASVSAISVHIICLNAFLIQGWGWLQVSSSSGEFVFLDQTPTCPSSQGPPSLLGEGTSHICLSLGSTQKSSENWFICSLSAYS